MEGKHLQLSLLILLGLVNAISCLRFAHIPVTVDTEVLIVNRPARLTCNYVKFRTEAVREIKWMLGYGGFNAQIFHYAVTTGKKEGSPYPFIKADDASATESELTVTLTDFRDSNMTLGCEVEVIRDNGYGKMRHSKKIGTSPVTVIDNRDHQLVLNPDREQGRTAQPGRDFTYSCLSRGAQPAPTLSLMVAGQNVSGMSRTRVEFPTSSGHDSAIVARIEDLPDSLFQNGFLAIECLAHFGDFLFDKKEMTLDRVEPDAESASSGYGGRSPMSNRRMDDYSQDSYNSHYRASNKDDDDHDDHERERGYGRGYGDSGSGDRQGRYDSSGVEHDDRAHDADVVHSRILDLIDPARHSHPGVPYDFFAGYILLVSDTLNAHADSTCTLWGELPLAAQNELARGYGRVTQLGGGGKAKVDMDAIKVLNALGQIGYRVIAASANSGGGYVWTLERRNFDISGRANDRGY